MARDDSTDMFAAFLIGAALGIGATLLLKEDDETDIQRLVRRVRKLGGRQPGRAVAAARDRGEDLVQAGRKTAVALREEAADIVAAARDEIQSIARDGVQRVRKARSRR